MMQSLTVCTMFFYRCTYDNPLRTIFSSQKSEGILVLLLAANESNFNGLTEF